MGIQVPLLVIDQRGVFGHVYIVLEPVGSARLTFRWQLLWVLWCWCTEGCSESRMRSRTWRGVSKWSRHKDWYIGSLCLDSGITPGEIGNFTGVPGGYRNPPGGQWALMGLSGKERKGPKCWPHLPPFPSPIRIRRRGRPPLSPFPLGQTLVGLGFGGRNPTPSGSRTPWRAPWAGQPLPFPPLYTGAGGTPWHTSWSLRSFLSRVRCPLPPNYTSIIPLRSLGEALRRWNIIIVTTPSCWRNSPSTLGWIGVRGTSSSWTCAELGGAVRSVLGSVGSWRSTTTSSTLRQRFRCWSTRVRRQHSHLVAMHHHDLACA